MNYEVGEWYQSLICPKYIWKYTGESVDSYGFPTIWYSERIFDDEYLKKVDYISNTFMLDRVSKISLSEIREYLPDDHPDKTRKMSTTTRHNIIKLINSV